MDQKLIDLLRRIRAGEAGWGPEWAQSLKELEYEGLIETRDHPSSTGGRGVDMIFAKITTEGDEFLKSNDESQSQ